MSQDPVMHGAPGFDPLADQVSFDDPAWVAERTATLESFLCNGPATFEELLVIRDLCNAVLALGNSAHSLWIKKPNQAGLDFADRDQERTYRLELSRRIATKFAMLPYLDYDRATEEEDLTVLMLSMLQAGFRPLGSAEEIYSFFESQAPYPMFRRADLPPPGKERKTRPVGTVLRSLPESWVRVAPFSQGRNVRTPTKQGDMQSIAADFKALSPEDQNKLLEALGVNHVSVAAQPQSAPGPPPAPPAGTNDVGRQIASGLAPVLQGLQASVQAMTSAVKKRAKADSDAEGSDSDGDLEAGSEKRLEKLCMFGGLQMARKKRLELKDFVRENEVEKIRAAQAIRKRVGLGKWDLLWNQSVDEQTSLLVQMEKLQHEVAAMDKASPAVASMSRSYERTLHTQLMGLKEKLEVLEECCKCASGIRNGGVEEAEAVYTLYTEMLAGTSETRLLKRLRTEAKSQLKHRREMAMYEDVAGTSRAPGGAPLGRQRELRDPEPRGRDPKGTRDRGQPSSANFVMKWVDGAIFDASLAGVQAPSPEKFPGFHMARLDGPNKGIIHGPGWKGSCGACGETGHGHSECPARRWTDNGRDYVNVRWLWEKGFCNAQGERK
jgi:hypothetical protein